MEKTKKYTVCRETKKTSVYRRMYPSSKRIGLTLRLFTHHVVAWTTLRAKLDLEIMP